MRKAIRVHEFEDGIYAFLPKRQAQEQDWQEIIEKADLFIKRENLLARGKWLYAYHVVTHGQTLTYFVTDPINPENEEKYRLVAAL